MSATVADNFLGLEPRHAEYRSARYALLPIPYDATTSYAVGTRDGPRAVISASQQVELYDEELGRESHAAGVSTLAAVSPDARGPAETMKAIHAAARRVVRDGKFLLGLGGEHSVSAPLIRAVAEKHPSLSVLQIDAHADLRDDYQGSPDSHACVMRRVHDLGISAVAVGVRNYSAEEARFIRRAGKPVVSARTCREQADWIPAALEPLSDTVYVTIDIDGFDPAYAPGTGTPEPGGLDWYQVADLLAQLAATRTIVAADVVEVRPIPGNNVTEFLAAKLLYRLIGLTARSRR